MRITCVLIGGLLFIGGLSAQQKKEAPDPTRVDADFVVQGEYVGVINEDGKAQKYGVRVGITQNIGEFKAIAYRGGLPGAGWDKKLADEKHKRLVEWSGQTKDGSTAFPKLLRGRAVVRDGVMTVIAPGGETIGELKRVIRQSPTLGAKPPAGATVLFDGSGLDHFVPPRSKMTDDKLLMIGARTKRNYTDFVLHMEFRVPYLRSPGHSAVFLQNSYHLAVVGRSFGTGAVTDLGCGGIRWVRAPDENMCLPPLTWQTFDVDYTAARFGADNKVLRNPIVTVRQNGVLIHDRVELPEMPPFYRGGGTDPLSPDGGPLQFQSHADDRHYVFRNVWIVERKQS